MRAPWPTRNHLCSFTRGRSRRCLLPQQDQSNTDAHGRFALASGALDFLEEFLHHSDFILAQGGSSFCHVAQFLAQVPALRICGPGRGRMRDQAPKRCDSPGLLASTALP